MRVVGIDTTTRAFCMALVEDARIVERILVENGAYHAEDFVAYLQDILASCSCGKEDIDGYSISIGPGSLTGVRVGLSFLKGIGFATGKPVVGIDTLYALAHEVRQDAACVCPMLATRREHLFWALYEFPGERAVVSNTCTSFEELLKMIPKRKMLFTGSGVKECKKSIAACLGDKARFDESGKRHPDPATIATLGLARIQKGAVPPLDALEPIYL